jgi:hypothetical protein
MRDELSQAWGAFLALSPRTTARLGIAKRQLTTHERSQEQHRPEEDASSRDAYEGQKLHDQYSLRLEKQNE